MNNVLLKGILAASVLSVWGVNRVLANEISEEIRNNEPSVAVEMGGDRPDLPLVTSNPSIVPEPLPSQVSKKASDLLEIPDTIAQNSSTPTEIPTNNNIIEPSGQNNTKTPPSQEELAKKSQNPIANMISVPFQNNTNFGVGDFDNTANILNIQPVLPSNISKNWVLINRAIIPVAYQPELAQIPLPNGQTETIGDVFGLGDIIYQGFFSPKDSGNITWGVGPILSFPSATDEVLGSGQWGAGPAFVGLVTSKRIVTGALISQLWSYAGDNDRPDVSLLSIQPFFNYNFNKGWYLSTSPIITANWQAEQGNQWTVPLGGGFGRVFKIGNQPVNLSLTAYGNVAKPEGAADWTLRTQFTLLFPN